jgi:hypothetical protein
MNRGDDHDGCEKKEPEGGNDLGEMVDESPQRNKSHQGKYQKRSPPVGGRKPNRKMAIKSRAVMTLPSI